MKKRLATVAMPIALLATQLAVTSTAATAAETLGESFSEGKAGYSLRWRWENVDQDPLPNDANAIPLRARINFHTADLYGFSAKAEFDYVFNFGVDDFNAGGGNTPNPPGYPVIADPGGEDLNQLFLQYKAKFGGQFRMGRQRIIYDNARFIGNVGWRQNEQTYDSFAFDHKTDSGWNFQYAYVDNVNRIFGDEVNAGDHAQSTNLFNVAYDFKKVGKLTGYYYDIDNQDVADFSNTTWGLRFVGKVGNEGSPIGYTLEYAHQTDNANNPVDYKANYLRVDLSAAIKQATVYTGYESLGGSDSEPGQAFRTPLATLHAFDGWADKFLKTPDAGLQDFFIGVKGKLQKWNWNVLYHNFSSESGSTDFGVEYDGVITRKFKDNYSVLFKAAVFKTDNRAYGDTTKFWVQLTADF
jgi:hypothetical protein